MKKSRTLLVALGLALAVGAADEASAKGFEGSGNFVCSTVEVVACTGSSICLQGHAHDFELPDFLFVEMAKKVVRATEESGQTESSPIKSVERTEHRVILQGFENHHGWTLAVDRRNGKMTLTSTGPDLSFMVFGACTAI